MKEAFSLSLFVKRDHYAHANYYIGEPMEEAMRDYETYPPMRIWADSLKYILLTLLGRLLPFFRPTERRIERIRQELLKYALEKCPTTTELKQDIDGIEELWPELKKKLQNNLGLVKLMEDGGARSRSFARFPATLVPRAIALESAFGANYDNAGIYHKLLPGCISTRYSAVEGTFVELRRRAGFVRVTIFHAVPLLASFRERPADKKLARIVTLGAGLVIEFRKFGWTLAQIQSLDIIACDVDETLLKELDVVFMHDFGVPFSESGIDYRFCSIEEVLADESLYGTATVVLMDGVLSYCRDKQQMLDYVAGMKKLLKPGGQIVCDWQVMEISLIRCAVVHCWESSMKPELTAGAAVKKAKWIAEQLGLEGKYYIDPRNPRPLGVIARYLLESSE